MLQGCNKMGKRGPKPRFLDLACPNDHCNLFGIAGKFNVTVYGTYTINSGKVRKYICHTCGTRFCDITCIPVGILIGWITSLLFIIYSGQKMDGIE